MEDKKNNIVLNSLLALLPVTLLFAFVYALVGLDLPFLQKYTWEAILTFIIGEVVILVAYHRRIRLLVILIATFLLYILLDSILRFVFTSEFDTFQVSIHYRLLFVVLLFSYISTYTILRYRWGPTLYCLVMALIGLPYIVMQDHMESSTYMILFAVLIILVMAVLLLSETFRSYFNHWKKLLRYYLVGAISLLILSVIIIAVGQNRKLEIEQIDDIQHGYTDSSLVSTKNGKVSVNDAMKPGGSNNNSNQLVFVAYIDNFFEDEFTANPLYLTAYHYSRFDSMTQEFEVDSLAPDEDIFRPDMSLIPITFSEIDSSIYSKASMYQDRHLVKMTLYNKGLAESEFLAPYTAYKVTRNALTSDLASEYVTSYTTESWVSDWNSAYFIYNPYSAPEALLYFQEQRFEELRQHNEYALMPTSFMRYYTLMPNGNQYDQMRNLADELVRKSGANTVLDKVLAIRDYFLSENLAGENLFEYSDNPGVPGVPDANLLYEFLFKTRKGYCAYFAGSGLFLLRAMNIPSRLSVGFLTVDRSDKSPGWYWYYQNQAHAWVQVYFPEIGWVDFDFTIGNDQAREAQQADGTAPVLPENPDFTTLAQILSIDANSQQIAVLPFDAKLYEEVMEPVPAKLDCDISNTTILKDSTILAISDLKKLDTIVLVIDDVDVTGQGGESQLTKLKNNLTISPDRIYLIEADSNLAQKKEIAGAGDDRKSTFGSIFLKILGGILLLILLTPMIILAYLFFRNIGISDVAKQSYLNNLAMLFVLNQVGVTRETESNLEFAMKKVDPKFGTEYEDFLRKYLQLKYDKNYTPSRIESTYLRGFFTDEFSVINKKISFRQKLSIFLNSPRALQFLIKYIF